MICEACGHEQDRGWFCRHCGARVDASDRRAEAAPWSRPERWVPAAIALLVLTSALVRLAGQGGGAAGAALPTAPDGGSVFAEATGTVLFLADGAGVVGLDLDAGTAERLELPGQRTADGPPPVWRLGHQLVVGRGGTVVVAPQPDGGTRVLGEATRFLPAADPQQLWLLDEADAGDADAGEPPGVWTLVAASGRTVTSIAAIAGYEPVRGLPRGLALRDRTGRLWRYDIAEDVLVEALGGASWIGDVVRSQVAWCPADPCRSLTVADAGGAAPVDIGGGGTFSEGQVWLSPAGDQVAAVVRAPGTDGAGVDRRLRVFRTGTGEVLADAPVPAGRAAGTWTVDGRQFFASVSGAGAEADTDAEADADTDAGATIVLARWAGASIELTDARSLGIADASEVVALPRSSVPGRSARVAPMGR